MAFYSSSTDTYASGFKTKIISQILDFIDVRKILKYSQYGDTQATLSAVQHSRLFSGFLVPNYISHDDCVSGKIGEIDIFFSEVRAEIEIHHYWFSYLNFTQYAEQRFLKLPIYIWIFI